MIQQIKTGTVICKIIACPLYQTQQNWILKPWQII